MGEKARKWTLDRLLDVGGMAAVYEATHRNGNQVAIKVMHPQYAANPDAKERFLREGYVANRVGHDDAVTVLDDDELADGTPFIVMELLEGGSFEGRLRQERVIPPAEAMFVADRVLDVLAAAHARSIIHRDIKPGNIYLTRDGGVKVLDFGLARVLDVQNEQSKTRTGTIIGTASFMSPEQARGKRSAIDHRTDIYAVGAVLFRAIGGRAIRTERSPMDRLIAAASEPAPSLADVTEGCPQAIVDVVDKALAFDKQQRWPDAATMQAALQAVYENLAGHTMPQTESVVSQLAGWVGEEEAGPAEEEISVVFSELRGGDSIVVEFEDVDSGEKRQQVRPVAGEVSVVLDDLSDVDEG